MPILWRSDGREYNADLIIIESAEDDQLGSHWVVEIKSNKDVTTDEVQAKRNAAQRWVNHVNASGDSPQEWYYLLVTETDIVQAKGSWVALKKLGT